MGRSWVWVSVFAITITSMPGRGQGAQPTAAGEALAGPLRAFLLEMFPDPLHEAKPGWGQTKAVLAGFKARGKGLHVRLEGQYEQRNHGTWKHVRLTAPNLPGTLAVEVRDVKKLNEEHMTFTVLVGLDAQVDYRKLKWVSGVRIYDASARARFKVKLALKCESVLRLEKGSGVLPDAVLRLRVLEADLRYDHLVCEHIAGFGGTPARLVGELIVASLKKYHPSLERKLLARANAAIVKAGDTKEVRIGLGKLFKGGG
jgi:hypothetical protein